MQPAYLVALLKSVFSNQELGALISFAAEKIGTTYDGSAAGVAWLR